MTTAYTSLLGLALPVTGELSGTWGDVVNTSITSLLDSAVAGTTTLTADADVTLSTTTGASNQSRQAIILWTASGTVTRTITVPAQSKVYTVINKSSTQSIKIVGVGPTTGVTVRSGVTVTVAWDGTDFKEVSIQALYPTVTISGNMDNGATDYSLTNTPTVTSAVTTQASIYRSYPSTAATAFTLTDLVGYRADQGTIGATSAVTNQYGFYANSGLTGATNNYGVYSGIAASSASTITGINGNGTVVTVTTAAAHGLVDNDKALIANVPDTLMTTGSYNGGPYTVSVISTVSFSYSSTAVSSASITSGNAVKANNWNFYGAGTGNNWFGGPTIVSTSSALPALRVTQSGTGYSFIVEDSTNPDTSPFAINAAGFVGIGTTLPTNALSVAGNADITGNTTLGDATTDTVTVNGYMGIGGAPDSLNGITVTRTSTGDNGNAVSGVLTAPNSVGTTDQTGVFGKVAIPNAAFTYTNAYGLYAGLNTKGAAATLTNSYGIYVANQTQGTNNYGIASAVTSGTNKWNIYASGTANNYFAGNVGIGNTAPSGLLHVQSTLAGNNQIILTNIASSNSSAGSEIVFTQGASGYAAGKIQCDREGSYSATASSQDSALVFFTATDGVDAEKMRIDSSGNVGIGNTPSGTYKLEVTGNGFFSGGVNSRVAVIANATSVTINADTTDIATQANTQAVGNLTINAPTGTPINGQKLIFRLQSTNAQTFLWNAVFAGSTDLVLPAVSSAASKYDYVGFIYNSTAAKWQMVAKVFGF